MKYQFFIRDDEWVLVLPSGDEFILDDHEGCALSGLLDVFVYSNRESKE